MDWDRSSELLITSVTPNGDLGPHYRSHDCSVCLLVLSSTSNLRQLRASTINPSRGADMVLELVGSSAALRLAFDALRPMGNLSSVGVHTDQAFPFGPVDGYNKNIRYL